MKAHGLKGGIKLELYTDEPNERFVPGAVFSLQVPSGTQWHGKSIELTELRWYNSHAVGFFKGVTDRTEAESLIKAILWIDQDPAQLPSEDDAWYDHQLVGLVALRDGVNVGVVSRVDHLPAQDLLAIKTDSGEVLVPFVKAIVPAVDIAAGTVTITPPNGLFEELPDEDSDADPAEPAATATAAADDDSDDSDADPDRIA